MKMFNFKTNAIWTQLSIFLIVVSYNPKKIIELFQTKFVLNYLYNTNYVAWDLPGLNTFWWLCRAWLTLPLLHTTWAGGRAGPSATFSQGSTHHDQLIKAPRVAPAHTSLWTLWYWAHLQRSLLVRLPDCIFGSIGQSLAWMLTLIRSLKDQNT